MEIGLIIGVLLVLVAMNCFILVAIHTLIARANRQVSQYFLKKMEVLDDDVMKRKEEVGQLISKKLQLERMLKKEEPEDYHLSKFYQPRNEAGNLHIPVARYVDDRFFEEYKSAKTMLKMDKKGILRKILNEVTFEGDVELYRIAENIENKLNVDVVYELVTLEPSEQINAVREVFQEEEQQCLDTYLQLKEESGLDQTFDCLSFINYVKGIKVKNDPNVYVRIGESDEEFKDVDGRIITEYDDNICEGMKIIYQSWVYDYSIYKTRRRA